jgi:uncharacterized protein DUF5681
VSATQNSDETATAAPGRPFRKGVSGNPGGRPRGLARYVRELVGDDGRRIADFMLDVLDDETERTETRMQAAAWLADRGFGKASIVMDAVEAVPVQIIVESAFERADRAAERFRADVRRLAVETSETA